MMRIMMVSFCESARSHGAAAVIIGAADYTGSRAAAKCG
jgi:hypothetical protein